MDNSNDLYQTYLKDCDCANGGIIVYCGIPVCRWCRKPYANGGQMSYLPEHFTYTSKDNLVSGNNVALQSRDWEIISFKDNKNEYDFFNINMYGSWSNARHNYTYTTEFLLENKYPIHSVRRLSDNSVWTAKDETTYGTIEKFIVAACGTMDVHFTNGCGATLASLQKAPITPLFVTEDGKNIYADMDYWKVWSNFKIDKYNSTDGARYDPDFVKHTFSTEERAKEYVALNKEYFSAKEIFDYLFPYVPSHKYEDLKNRFIEMSKSKLTK